MHARMPCHSHMHHAHLVHACPRDAEGGFYEDGVIEEWCAPASCYIVLGQASRFAVQFHQFTVEEEEGEQLVLKVPRCTRVPLPPGYAADLRPPAAELEPELPANTAGGRRALERVGCVAGLRQVHAEQLQRS